MTKINFSGEDTEKICKLFENGAILKEIGKNFGCSYSTIRKILIEMLGLEKYTEIAKEHSRENSQENGRKIGPENGFRSHLEIARENGQKNGPKNLKKWRIEHPEELKENGRKLGLLPKTEKQIKTSRKNGRKMGLLPKTKKQLNNWQSSWEDKFYNLLTTQNPHLTVKRQYYLKGLNHAYDLAIPELKILIEIDGDYYHGHSGNKEMDAERIKRDVEIDKWAKDNGWTVIRINEKLLKKLNII